MKKNMGSFDRIIRLVIAAVAVNLYVANVVTGTWGIVLMALAAVFLLTSFIGVCPLYLPFGISTLRKKFSSKEHVR